MRIHRTDLFALIALAWQAVIVWLICAGITGDVSNLLASLLGVPWNAYSTEKILLTVALLELPLLAFAVYWFRKEL